MLLTAQEQLQDSQCLFKTPTHDVIPDRGSSRTILSKSVLDQQGIKFEPNFGSKELFNASNIPMTVNGTAQLTTTFNGKSKQIDGLVSEDLKDHILLSWFDAEDLGSFTITQFTSLGNPTKRIDKLKKKYESILKDSLSDKPMQGPPMKVHFKKEALEKGVRPKKVFTVSQTPLHVTQLPSQVIMLNGYTNFSLHNTVQTP